MAHHYDPDNPPIVTREYWERLRQRENSRFPRIVRAFTGEERCGECGATWAAPLPVGPFGAPLPCGHSVIHLARVSEDRVVTVGEDSPEGRRFWRIPELDG